MKVAAVVVTYNRKMLLQENIESLLNQSKKDVLDVIIIDNASTDGTNEILKPFAETKKIIYKNTEANLGGAGGFQYGIKYAAENQYDFIWVMDDDCIPQPNTLEELLNADKKLNHQYGFLSSKVLWKDGNICAMNVQRKTLTKNVTDFSSKFVPITMASFVSLFIPLETIRKEGLPIREFFIWTDDWEYTRRISLHRNCYLVNDSVVVHKSSSNIGANISNDSLNRLDRYDYLYRNDVYLYRREGITGLMYEVIRLLFHSSKVIVKAPNCKIKRLKKIWGGTLNGISFDPTIEYVKK